MKIMERRLKRLEDNAAGPREAGVQVVFMYDGEPRPEVPDNGLLVVFVKKPRRTDDARA